MIPIAAKLWLSNKNLFCYFVEHLSTWSIDTKESIFNNCDICLQLQALMEEVELERKIAANMAEGKSTARKRGERKRLTKI